MGETRNYSRIVTKWLGFVTAIWVQSISGNNYTFGNYSADLKDVMNYNQVELNGLGVAKDVGKGFGVLAGFLADFLPPQVILMIGATIGAVGYGTTWLVVSQRIAPPSFWQMCIIVFMGGNSTTWMNTAVLVTCMRNFSGSRGTVSGILKGYVGLSTAIFTVLCSALFTGDSSAFLLLLTFLPAIICMIAVIFLRRLPVSGRESADERTSFMTLNVISLALAVYLLGYTFFGDNLSALSSKLFAVGLLLFVLSPVVVPARLLLVSWKASVKGKDKDESKESLLGDARADSERAQTKAGETTGEKNGEDVSASNKGTVGSLYEKPNLGDNFGTVDMLKTLDFWFLFLTFLSAIGTGMAVINNMGQIGEALGHPDVAMYISFFSIFGFFGRIGAGAVSERFVKSAALPRPVWMAMSKLLMILGYLALAWGLSGSLMFGSIIVGMCYGIHMTTVVATSSEMFGLKNFGLTYNLLVLNIPLGSFLFSGLLAGYLYDKEVESTTPAPSPGLIDISLLSDEETTCYGTKCYRQLFIIMSAVLAVALVMDIFLILRLRPLYQKLYGSRRTLSSSSSS